jgi:GT2 family glycosyltransferase
MNSTIDVSIVIISWKMKNLLEKCLQSILNFSNGLQFELIVIDNNSNDGTSEMIKNNFPEVKLIQNNRNKGVAPARNQGIRVSKGKYIMILDADVELLENSICKLFQFMEKNESCGIVGCMLIDKDGNLQYSCKRFPTFLAFIFRRLEYLNIIKKSKTLKYHTMQEWDHQELAEVDYIIGACQFIRRDVINKIGYYDDKIFYGPEDIDYCLRIWKAGWKVYYYPYTKIMHHEQRITKKNFFSFLSLKHFIAILYIYFKYRGNLQK